MKLRVSGRGKLFGEARSDGGTGTTLRIDDERNDEFWAEIHLTREELQRLLDGHHYGDEPSTDLLERDPDWTPEEILRREA